MEQYSIITQSEINSSRTTLIGVYHNSDTNKETTEEVITALNPDVIAVETSPERWKIADSGALGKSGERAVQIAREELIDIALIDEDNTPSTDAEKESGIDPPIPSEMSDTVVDSLEERRKEILKDAQSDFILHAREKKMAEVICALSNLYDDIVVVVGAAHIMGVSQRMEYVDTSVISEDRLITLSEPHE